VTVSVTTSPAAKFVTKEEYVAPPPATEPWMKLLFTPSHPAEARAGETPPIAATTKPAIQLRQLQ
jgi:hypothetical protein